jgi:hypothetical protein
MEEHADLRLRVCAAVELSVAGSCEQLDQLLGGVVFKLLFIFL